MYSEKPTLTDSVPEVTIPLYSRLDHELAPNARQRLDELRTNIEALSSPDMLPDDTIQESLQKKVNVYLGWYKFDLMHTLNYLGQAESDTALGENTADLVSPSTPTKSARKTLQDDIRQIVQGECYAVGMDTADMAEALLIADSHSSEQGSLLADDIKQRYDRFNMLATTFGSPDVLRAEAQAAAIERLNQFTQKLGNLQGRPDKDTIAQRLGRLMSGNLWDRRSYDREVDKRFDRFEMPPVENLLESYVQQAMIHYAKLCFGETPHVLDQGFDGDCREFYDTFQAKSAPGKTTRPHLPSELTIPKVGKILYDITFSGRSLLKDMFEKHGDKYQRQDRDRRKSYGSRYIYSSLRTRYRNPPSADTIGSGGYVPRQHVYNINHFSHDEQPDQDLNPAMQKLHIEFSQVLSSVRWSDAERPDIPLVEEDFVNRLLHEQEKYEQARPMTKILIRAMRDYHPDMDSPTERADALYKVYSRMHGDLTKRQT